MLKIAIALSLVIVNCAALPTYASQCDPTKPVRVDIPAQALGDAAIRFTELTGCPVSIDVDVVANVEAKDVPTYVVSGRMTPIDALETMLYSSPLSAKQIRGGYSIFQN